MPQSQIRDNALLDRIAKGDSSALSVLYDRYNALVFSIALNVLADIGDAEEVTLDVFNRIWEKAGTCLSAIASVKAWISRIARNRSIDLLRQKRSRLTGHNPRWADVCLDCMPDGNNPEQDLEAVLIHKEIADAIAQLPQNQQDALSLAYFKGLTHGEIAEVLDEPLGTVKTRIRSAMQTLRKIIAGKE